MSKRAQENLIALAFLLIFVFFFVVSMSYSAKARLVPMPIAVVSALLVLLQIYLQNFKPDLKLNVDTMDLFAKYRDDNLEDVGAGVEKQETERGSRNRKELQAFGVVVFYLGLILLFGLMPGTFLFVLCYFLFIGKNKWYKSLLFSGISTAVLYLLFAQVLQIWMYDGWIATTFFQH